ncbi:MAG: hypothetical protein IIT68_00430 [Treponema sp.]|nr:hypothetical protein [Treponema sp.]
MREMKKSRAPVVLTVLFCILYILLAIRPLSTELSLQSQWTIDIQQEAKPASATEETIPFKLGQSMGYFTADGTIVSSITFPFKAAISNTWCAAYSAGNTQTTLVNSQNQTGCTLNVSGYPYFAENRIYIFLPGGSAVAQYNDQGFCIWQHEGYAPITAFSSSQGGSVIGYADGTVISYTAQGIQDQYFAPGGSQTEVVLGAAISPDGKTVACITGLNQQRFIIARKEGNTSRIIHHHYIDKQSNEQQLVQFSKDAQTIFYSCSEGLAVVELGRKKAKAQKIIPIEGSILQIEESETEDFVYVLSRKDETCTVTILEGTNTIAASFSFAAHNAFIQTKGSALFVGKDSKISRIDVSRS